MKKVIQSRVDAKDIKALEEIAEEKGHTISSIIRLIIKRFIRSEKGKKKR